MRLIKKVIVISIAFVAASVHTGGRHSLAVVPPLGVGSDHVVRRTFAPTREMILASRENQDEALVLWVSRVEAPVDDVSRVLRVLNRLVLSYLPRAFESADGGSSFTREGLEDQIAGAVFFGGIQRIDRAEASLKARIQHAIDVYDQRIVSLQQKLLECPGEDECFYLRMIGVLEVRKRVLVLQGNAIHERAGDSLEGI